VAKFGSDPIGDLRVKMRPMKKMRGWIEKNSAVWGPKFTEFWKNAKALRSSKFYFGASVACCVNSRLNRDVAFKLPEHRQFWVSRFREGNPQIFDVNWYHTRQWFSIHLLCNRLMGDYHLRRLYPKISNQWPRRQNEGTPPHPQFFRGFTIIWITFL